MPGRWRYIPVTRWVKNIADLGFAASQLDAYKTVYHYRVKNKGRWAGQYAIFREESEQGRFDAIYDPHILRRSSRVTENH